MLGVRKETICECVIFHNERGVLGESGWGGSRDGPRAGLGREHLGLEPLSKNSRSCSLCHKVINIQEMDPRV